MVAPARVWRFKSSRPHKVEIKGRLAQLVERFLDVKDVRGSSPLPPTKYLKSPLGDFRYSDKPINCPMTRQVVNSNINEAD